MTKQKINKINKRQQKNRQKMTLWGLFFAAILTSMIAEHFVDMHPMFGLDGRMFFYAWFGLIMCTIMVLFSRFLGFFLKRQDGYYKEDRND